MRLGQSISGSWDTLTEGGCVECMLILVHIWNGQSISGPQDTLTRGGLCAVNTLPGILLGWSEYLSEGELCVMYTHPIIVPGRSEYLWNLRIIYAILWSHWTSPR